MNVVYELIHKRLVETDINTGEKIYNTKILGYFSCIDICKDIIPQYLDLEGFKEFPNDFYIDEVEADVDDYNNKVGHFDKYVYFLSHEWYDGTYDNVNYLGYYSTLQNAEDAKMKYCNKEEFIKYQDGFCISRYEIDKRKWTEGFSYTK